MGMLTNQNGKKREIRTVLQIASQDGELLLFHGRMPPDAMKQSFPRLASRFPQESTKAPIPCRAVFSTPAG